MFFQYPAILLLLWILPGVAWLLVRAERKRAVAARRFVGQPMVPRLMPRLGGPRPWIKGSLVLLSLAMIIVAAARPRFGVYFEKVVRRGVDCFVLLDVSRSMLAEDVAPNRLERAKSDIRDLLAKLVGDRVGLIVFAGKPSLKVPLTTDEGFFRAVLDEIDVRSAPRGGTLIGDAIRKALEAMPPRADHDQVLVLITDGEDQDSFPLEAAKQAAERGVKIFTIGLGDSAEGARIPIRDASGKLQFLKEDGKEHWSKADQDALRQIALSTGGAHVPVGTRAYDLGQIYEDHLANLARGEDVQEQKRKRRRDRYQLFLMLAVALFAAGTLIPAHARASRNHDSYGGSSERQGIPRSFIQAHGLQPVGFTEVNGHTILLQSLLAALLLLPAQALASPGDAAREVDKGLGAFRGGDFKAAAAAFSAADRALPDQPRIAFDLGCAYAAEGKHDEAAEQFRAAALAQDGKLAATAHYNLGCLEVSKAKTRFGEHPEQAAPGIRKEGIAALLQAAGHFRDSLAVDPQHADARYNLEMVRLWIEYIEEVWRQRDRDKLRKEMNLLQFLEMLEGRQRELRLSGRKLAERPASPLRSEEIQKIEQEQRYLAEEIEPLKAKIAAALSGSPQPGGTASPAGGADAQKALALLNKLGDEVRGAMLGTADSLADGNMPDAVASQSASVEKLDQIFMVVAPFVNLVQKAVKTQQGLVDQSKGATSTKGESEKGKKGEKDKKDEAAPDWGEAAWNQRFISGYGRILPAKAQREMEQLEKAPAAAQPAMPAPQNGKAENLAEAAEKQKKQMEEMKRALKAGVELAPKVEKLSTEAAASLEAARPADALPLQEEALKLLKEMLPKQERQKNDQNNKNDQNKQDRQNKNRKKQDQKNKDQKDKDQQQKDQHDKDKDQQKKDRQNKDRQKQDQQKKDREQDKSQVQRQRQQQERLSKQEAEAVMRKARQRQQERKELAKALQERLYRNEKVDKDW